MSLIYSIMSGTCFIFLLLAHLAYLASADVDIDCGSTLTTSAIGWMPDDNLIQNGLSYKVSVLSDYYYTAFGTLRAFTTRKKNCYTIGVEKGSRVLVQASFLYGNYDKKSNPPAFDLHLDGNLWGNVQTSMTDVIDYEIIYTVKGNSTSVCVAQTKPNQFPFMSALVVRSLPERMYSQADTSAGLFLKSRQAFGTNETIREKLYGRNWRPSQAGSGLKNVQNEALFISTTNAEDYPPKEVLENAITPQISGGIVFSPEFPTSNFRIYMTMYFSEVIELDSTQKRQFIVYQDDNSISDTIIPPYNDVYEYVAPNLIVSTATKFSVEPTVSSTLPALINAMEVYYIDDIISDGTDENDVEGLVSLLENFEILQEWSGEPCLPATYTWDWLNCNKDSTPRVTSLDLSSFGLSGSLPDFSTMTALETIDLHNNSLSGAIPDFLGNLPNLKALNLADNQFSGPIPTSLSENKKIKLVVTGNPNVCSSGQSCKVYDSPSTTFTTNKTTKKSKNKLPLILGITIPSFVIFWAIVLVVALLIRKRRLVALATARGTGHNQYNSTPQAQSSMPGNFGQEYIEQRNVIELSKQTEQRPSAQGNGQYPTYP